MRQLPFIIIPIIFASCSPFEGKIEDRNLAQNDSTKYFFITNKSSTKKFRFTVKETALISNENKNFRILFYELQPGEEVQIGPFIKYGDQNFKNEYIITSNDTIKEVIDHGIRIKRTPPKYYNKPPFYVDKTQYFKNKKEIDVFDFLSVSNESILIDSLSKGNIETRTYQVPIKSLSKQIPLPRIKTTYKYEITGQVILKNKS